MGFLNSLWYLGAGFLLGWIVSTLIEWLWFRRRRLQGSADRTPMGERTTVSVPPSPSPEPDDRSREEVSDSDGHLYRTQEERGDSVAQAGTGAEPAPAGEEPRPRRVAVVRRPSTPQQTASVEPADRPDPLSVIRGIGEIYQRRLYQAGIYTWHQLANTDPATLRAATKAQASSNPESWIEQARQLAREHNRQGAIYAGPMPDDLTRIDGIGPAYEQELYQAGIVTFAQLAQFTPAELATILSGANLVGEEPDYRDWIEQAARLSGA